MLPAAESEVKPKPAVKTKPKSPSDPKAKPGAKGPAAKNTAPPAEPPAPFIDFLFPAGGERGKSLEITASGTGLAGASTVSVGGGGVAAKIVKVTDETTVALAVTVAADAELGEHDVRLTTVGGVSNRFRFIVGELPEVNQTRPNFEPKQAQLLPSLPVVVNGQVFEADRDYYRFTAKEGQLLVFDVQGRALLPFMADAVPGWLDACLTLSDGNGKELAYVDDYHLKPDPVLFFQVPKDGQYVIEIHDILFRGRGNFVYRLKIGVLPYITRISPLGGRRGTTVPVQLFGVNLPAKTLDLTIPADAPPLLPIEVQQDGLHSNTVYFAVGDAPEVQRVAANETPKNATRVQAPVTINGRIERPGELHHYTFHAKANRKLVMEIRARRLDSPLDSILTLFDPKGIEVAENDDTVDPAATLATNHADSRLVYTTKAAGDYVLRVADVQGNGGEDYAYRLEIGPPRPDFALRITPDNVRVGQGESTVVAVVALRKDDFNGEIQLELKDLPPGFIASEALIAAGQDQTRLTITAPPGAPRGVFSPTILGSAKLDKDATVPVVRKAVPAEAMKQSFFYQHNVPTQQFSLAVVEPASFNLSLDLPPGKVLEIRPGSEVKVPVKVFRKEGFRSGLALAQEGQVQGIEVRGAFVPANQDSGTLTLSVRPQAKPGPVQNLIVSLSLRATAKRAITRVAPAIQVKVVAAEPAKKDAKVTK